MYEREFKFLQDHIDLVENNKFDELFKLKDQSISWENVLKICYDPDVDINPLEGLTTIPKNFFSRVNLDNIDLVIPKAIDSIDPYVFYGATFQSIKFENPDCECKLYYVTADTIIMPANSTLDDPTRISLTEIDAKVILSKNTDYIADETIKGTNPNLILIWTSPKPVKVGIEYTPVNKNRRCWHVTKHNLHIRR